MLAGLDDLLEVTSAIYGDRPLPRSLALLRAAREVRRGFDPKPLASGLGTTARRLVQLASSTDPVLDLFKTTLGYMTEMVERRRRQSLGQLLLGRIAERAFERLYRRTLGAEELVLEDERTGYSETDYRILNGAGRQVFRLNIKFHGTLFANAKDMVGLEPADCFALATYKVWQGQKKQQKDTLPYVFAIVSVPGLTSESVGAIVPMRLVELAAFGYAAKSIRKRDLEDAIVRYLVEDERTEEVAGAIAEYATRIEAAEWRVISARKADNLLRKLLFERVFALRQRNFAQTQANMHFSLSGDLTSLMDLLQLWRERGPQGVASILERGDM